jgi:Lon protease-like protein
VNDVLAGDRRFAVFLLRPDAGRPAAGEPDPFEIGCLGEILRAEALAEGRFNVLLGGLVRIKIHEFLTEVPYRVVGATPAPELTLAGVDSGAATAFREVVRRYFRAVLRRPLGQGLIEGPFEALVNTAAANLESDVYERQSLLETGSLPRRMARVANRMQAQLEVRRLITAARRERPADPRLN